jgi:hypothetical protein
MRLVSQGGDKGGADRFKHCDSDPELVLAELSFL